MKSLVSKLPKFYVPTCKSFFFSFIQKKLIFFSSYSTNKLFYCIWFFSNFLNDDVSTLHMTFNINSNVRSFRAVALLICVTASVSLMQTWNIIMFPNDYVCSTCGWWTQFLNQITKFVFCGQLRETRITKYIIIMLPTLLVF